MTERVYIPYQPVIGVIPPNGIQWRLKMSDKPWTLYSGTRVNEYDRAAFEFRVPAPEEDDAEWEDVPLGAAHEEGDVASIDGSRYQPVDVSWIGEERCFEYERVRRRKAVEPQKPLQKPKNIDLMHLLAKAAKAINGDQAKLDQINAAKAVFAARVMEIMGVTE